MAKGNPGQASGLMFCPMRGAPLQISEEFAFRGRFDVPVDNQSGPRLLRVDV